MEEYLIASLECMQSDSMKYKKSSLLILSAGSLLETMDWASSKAVAITASKISVFTHMMYGRRRKSIVTKKTLETVQMDVSFVWNPILLGVCHKLRMITTTWCVQFVIIHFHLYNFAILIKFLIDAYFCLKLLFLLQADDTSKFLHLSVFVIFHFSLAVCFWMQQGNDSHLSMTEIVHKDSMIR